MGLLHLLIAALVASAALAADDCACVKPEQTIDPINVPMIFFQQPTIGGKQGGVTCSMPCEFIAHLDAGADEYSLQIQLLTNKIGTGSITVDGMNGDPISISSNTQPQTFAQKSYGDTIQIHFKEDASNLGEFMLVISKVEGRPDAPVTKPATVAPITAPYDEKKFHNNPLLVSDDIMLAFDLSSNDLEKYKTFAKDMIAQLTVNPKDLTSTADNEYCDAGSRLTVVGLSSLSGFDNLYAPFWTTTAVQATGNIDSLFQIGTDPYYYSPVDTKYAGGFNEPNTYCKNRGKVFILFTSSPPVECDMSRSDCSKAGDGSDVPITKFVDSGIHQILVNYNMDSKNMKFYDLYNGTSANPTPENVWNYFPLSGTDKDIENFFNNFLVDSVDQMTCQLKQKTDQTTVEIGTTDVEIRIPPYYKAKGVAGGVWTTPRHYCNFQETTVTLKRDGTITDPKPEKQIPMCVKVYYDLETGKDFVSIYSGDPKGSQKEVVRLTGSDVSGTVFELPDTIGSIVFKSDEKNVFDGFYAKITKKDGDKECE